LCSSFPLFAQQNLKIVVRHDTHESETKPAVLKLVHPADIANKQIKIKLRMTLMYNFEVKIKVVLYLLHQGASNKEKIRSAMRMTTCPLN